MRRHELAAVRDQRVEARHLQGRHGQVALADCELHRVAGLPDPVDVAATRRAAEVHAAPLRRRHEPPGFGGDVDPRVVAEPEPRCPQLQRMPAARRQCVEVVPHLVEVGVARLCDRGRELDPVHDVRVPVVERLTGDGVRRRAEQRRVRRDDVLLQRRERGHGLPRGARRIADVERPVESREVLARGDVRILERRELRRVAADVDRRLVGRRRGEREHRPVAGVDGDDRPTVGRPLAVVVRDADAVAQCLLGGALHGQVERQPDRVAPPRRDLRLDRARRPSTRVDGQLCRAGGAAQVLVVARLDACLSDHVPELVALAPFRLQLRLRDLADVAEHVRGERLVRVLAQVALAEADAREVELVLREIAHLVVVDAAPDDHRRERVAGVLTDAPVDLLEVDAGDRGEMFELVEPGVLVLRQVGRPELDARAERVLDEHAAVAIEDQPALRVDRQLAHAVVVRLGEVLVA